MIRTKNQISVKQIVKLFQNCFNLKILLLVLVQKKRDRSLKRKCNLLSLGWIWNVSISFNLAVIKVNLWALSRYGGAVWDSKAWVAWDSERSYTSKGSQRTRWVFEEKKCFAHFSPLWYVIFYNLSIPK